MAVLIVGGDSRLSRELIPALCAKGNKVYATTRRIERVALADEVSLHLDLGDVDKFNLPDDVRQVVFVGGVVDYRECADRQEYAFQVNCVNIPKIARQMLLRRGYVCFISTNTVFKFERGLPGEKDKRCPGFSYAELKASAEQRMEVIAKEMGCVDRLSILRLTKNVGPDTAPFGSWARHLRAHTIIRPFRDLYFAPVRFADSAHTVELLLQRELAGIFHLSGEKDIDYASFAIELCRYAGLSEALVEGVESSEAGVKLEYNHPITALGMQRTRLLLGLEPVPLAKIYEELLKLLR